LQAHFPEQRLLYMIADAGDFEIEGVERKQRLTRGGRREQRCQETVMVAAAQQFATI